MSDEKADIGTFETAVTATALSEGGHMSAQSQVVRVLDVDYGLQLYRRGRWIEGQLHSSTIGFEEVQRRIDSMSEWLRYPHTLFTEPSPDQYQHYLALIERVRQNCARRGRKCEAWLQPQLIGKEGHWVAVSYENGHRDSFLVVRDEREFFPVHVGKQSIDQVRAPEIRGIIKRVQIKA